MKNSYIGIDVSKRELAIYTDEKHFSIENSKSALIKWVKDNKKHLNTAPIWVYEPTGGYEKTLASFLHENDLPGHRVHANHVRSFIKARGQLAKTDKIDAKMIHEFATIFQFEASLQEHEHVELVALMNRRQQLLKQKKEEGSRIDKLASKAVLEDIEEHIAHLESRISCVEGAMKSYIKSKAELSAYLELLRSVTGVGWLVAVGVVCYLPELTELEEASVSALAGLAPINRDSGNIQKKRSCQGGRSSLRQLLYMSALSASQHNVELKVFYERLKRKGKPFKVCITAVMRKLLSIIRAVAKRGTPWVNELRSSESLT